MGMHLSRSRRVLRFHTALDKSVTFQQDETLDGAEGRFTFVSFEVQTWKDMGEPQEITVSLEPGNVIEREAKSGSQS